MDIPQAYTPPDAQRPPRVAEFEKLLTESVTSVQRIAPGLLRLLLPGS